MAWTFDPPAPPVTKRLRITAGGEEHRVSVTCTPWDARARLRYTDASQTRAFEFDPTTGRDVVKIATLNLIATAITVTAADGFPDVKGEPFNPQREDHLLSLPTDVYLAVMRVALDVQPLPGRRTATSVQVEGDDEVVEDPTRTPSTQEAPSTAPATGSRTRTRTSTPTS